MYIYIYIYMWFYTKISRKLYEKYKAWSKNYYNRGLNIFPHPWGIILRTPGA